MWLTGVSGYRRWSATMTPAPIHAGNVSEIQLTQSDGWIAETTPAATNDPSSVRAYAERVNAGSVAARHRGAPASRASGGRYFFSTSSSFDSYSVVTSRMMGLFFSARRSLYFFTVAFTDRISQTPVSVRIRTSPVRFQDSI